MPPFPLRLPVSHSASWIASQINYLRLILASGSAFRGTLNKTPDPAATSSIGLSVFGAIERRQALYSGRCRLGSQSCARKPCDIKQTTRLSESLLAHLEHRERLSIEPGRRKPAHGQCFMNASCSQGGWSQISVSLELQTCWALPFCLASNLSVLCSHF